MWSFSCARAPLTRYAQDRRYVINPNQGFARQLTKWGQRKPSDQIMFQCHCGACIYGTLPVSAPVAAEQSRVSASGLSKSGAADELLERSSSSVGSGAKAEEDFDLEAGPKSIVVSGNILACHCDAPDVSPCPLLGCQDVLDAAHTKLSFLADNLMWTFASPTLVQLQDMQFVTVAMPAQRTRASWAVYRCRTCEMVTHAVRQSPVAGKPDRFALVSNIPVLANSTRVRQPKPQLLNPQFRLSAPPSKDKSADGGGAGGGGGGEGGERRSNVSGPVQRAVRTSGLGQSVSVTSLARPPVRKPSVEPTDALSLLKPKLGGRASLTLSSERANKNE